MIRTRAPWLDCSLGIGVLVFGLWQVKIGDSGGWAEIVITIAMAAAASLYRLRPAWALVLVWAVALLQVKHELDVTLVQLAALVVAYGTTRYGRVATVWVSGISLVSGSLAVIYYVHNRGTSFPSRLGLSSVVVPTSLTGVASGFVLVLATFAAPWGLGLIVRLSERNRITAESSAYAEAQVRRAQQAAGLESERARLARDVHDVVGHSLAVILAQADSAQFIDDTEIHRIRAAMANIASSARQSLGEVREVLSNTGGETSIASGSIDSRAAMLADLRAAGYALNDEVLGEPAVLAPELDLVAYRVLQEMLTNAIKHGRRDLPLSVRHVWRPGELIIEVCNAFENGAQASPDGMGLSWMRQRLQSVGGSLQIHDVQPDTDGSEFAVTAVVPVPLPSLAGELLAAPTVQ